MMIRYTVFEGEKWGGFGRHDLTMVLLGRGGVCCLLGSDWAVFE